MSTSLNISKIQIHHDLHVISTIRWR